MEKLKKQLEDLKDKVAKNCPNADKLRKSIDEKLKNVNKPIKK